MRKSRENDWLRLRHKLDAAQLASGYVDASERRTVEANPLLQRGLVKTIQDIGEAASKVTRVFRLDHPDIPWRDMSDMRNFLVHDYFEIDLDVVWKAAVEDLPPLIAQLEELLSTQDPLE